MTFFLFLPKNICCGYLLEAPHRGTSNEYPQHMFLGRNKKRIMWIPPLELSFSHKYSDTLTFVFTFYHTYQKILKKSIRLLDKLSNICNGMAISKDPDQTAPTRAV